MSFNLDSYLFRLSLKRAKPSLLYLKELQTAHQRRIPLENFDIFLGVQRPWKVENLFHKIIVGKRGGLGIELNAIFGALLMHLGFRAMYVGLNEAKKTPAERLEHLAVIVNLEGDLWLVDVGRASQLINPIPLAQNRVMLNYTHYVKLTTEDDTWYYQTSQDAVHFEDQFTFLIKERKLIEFLRLHDELQSIYESPQARERSISKVQETGRLTLTPSKLEWLQGSSVVRSETIRNEEDFDLELKEHFWD